jgi:hypothetical protein
MMRESTKTRYSQILKEMIDKNVNWKEQDRSAISVKRFKSFTVIYILFKGGFLTTDKAGKESIRKGANIKEIVDWIEMYMDESYKKQQMKKKALTEMVARENGHAPVVAGVTKLPPVNGVMPDQEKAIKLVRRLREMGYEVTCKRILEL